MGITTDYDLIAGRLTRLTFIIGIILVLESILKVLHRKNLDLSLSLLGSLRKIRVVPPTRFIYV